LISLHYAARGKQASFLKYSNSLLESVQQLRLSWCKCIPCKTGKFGGWVSENYLGAARIFAWLYSYADFIAPDISDLSILNLKPQQRWTRLQAMVCRIMSLQPDLYDCELHIKYFLSYFETFDRAMRRSNESPSWITSYNYICLTNIPQILKNFGPVRNLWEGGGQGEKIVGLLRPLWNGYRLNWHKNIMDNILKQMSISHIKCNNNENEDGDSNKDAETSISTYSYYRYGTIATIQSKYTSGKPLSVVLLSSNTFGCCTSSSRIIFIRLMSVKEQVHGL